MKKILSLILALVMMITAAAAFAETASETPAGDKILSTLISGLKSQLGGSENGFNLLSLIKPLMKKLGSGNDARLQEIIGALKQKLGSALGGSGESGMGIDLSSLIGLLGGSDESGTGIDLSSLIGLLGGGAEGTEGTEGIGDDDLMALLGLLAGDDSGDGDEEFDLDAFLEEYRATPEYQEYLARFEARRVYLNEEFFELEKGDEQVVAASTVENFDVDDPNTEFGDFVLINFRADGKDLKEMNRAATTELLTYEKQEDGTFKVVSAVIAEEGEGRDASIQAMCDTFGVPMEDYVNHLIVVDYDERDYLRDFLREHPEYERIECMGEMMTLEELDAIQEAFWEEVEVSLGI